MASGARLPPRPSTSARCSGAPLSPDTHVIRVLQRLGFVKRNATTEAVYDAVMTAAGDFGADDLFRTALVSERAGAKDLPAAGAVRNLSAV